MEKRKVLGEGKWKKENPRPFRQDTNPGLLARVALRDSGKAFWGVGAFKSGNQLNEMQRTINKSASDEDAPLAK